MPEIDNSGSASSDAAPRPRAVVDNSGSASSDAAPRPRPSTVVDNTGLAASGAAPRPGAAQRSGAVVDWAVLRNAATAAMHRAYAPYSRFPVGAAGLVADGRILTGCNVENASYGLALCAECGVVSALALSGGGRLLALSCVDCDGAPLMPCGRCRQLLWEHGGPDCLVDAKPEPVPMARLLPNAFDAAELDRPARLPVKLREYQGRGTVFVHPDMSGRRRVWTGYWERSSGTGDGEPAGILEEAPTWPQAEDVITWGRARTDRVVVVDANGATFWAGIGDSPSGMAVWSS